MAEEFDPRNLVAELNRIQEKKMLKKLDPEENPPIYTLKSELRGSSAKKMKPKSATKRKRVKPGPKGKDPSKLPDLTDLMKVREVVQSIVDTIVTKANEFSLRCDSLGIARPKWDLTETMNLSPEEARAYVSRAHNAQVPKRYSPETLLSQWDNKNSGVFISNDEKGLVLCSNLLLRFVEQIYHKKNMFLKFLSGISFIMVLVTERGNIDRFLSADNARAIDDSIRALQQLTELNDVVTDMFDDEGSPESEVKEVVDVEDETDDYDYEILYDDYLPEYDDFLEYEEDYYYDGPDETPFDLGIESDEETPELQAHLEIDAIEVKNEKYEFPSVLEPIVTPPKSPEGFISPFAPPKTPTKSRKAMKITSKDYVERLTDELKREMNKKASAEFLMKKITDGELDLQATITKCYSCYLLEKLPMTVAEALKYWRKDERAVDPKKKIGCHSKTRKGSQAKSGIKKRKGSTKKKSSGRKKK